MAAEKHVLDGYPKCKVEVNDDDWSDLVRKIECDKCGKDLASLRPEWFGVKVELPTQHLSIDLCESCTRRLKAWCESRDPVAA